MICELKKLCEPLRFATLWEAALRLCALCVLKKRKGDSLNRPKLLNLRPAFWAEVIRRGIFCPTTAAIGQLNGFQLAPLR